MTAPQSNDRFTDATRNCITTAKKLVMEYKHSHITPEHIFLGLLQDQTPLLLTALSKAKAKPDQMKQLVLHHLKPTDNAVPEEWITFSERAKRVIETAKEEAQRVRATQIGPEHLLLGLTRVNNTIAGAVLRAVQLDTESVRKAIGQPPAA